MRQIDADALKVALFQKHVHDGEELEPMLYYADAVKVIDDAPTVDAIPVAWLKEQRKEALQKGMRPFEVEGVEIILWLWLKEQEANT